MPSRCPVCVMTTPSDAHDCILVRPRNSAHLHLGGIQCTMSMQTPSCSTGALSSTPAMPGQQSVVWGRGQVCLQSPEKVHVEQLLHLCRHACSLALCQLQYESRLMLQTSTTPHKALSLVSMQVHNAWSATPHACRPASR